MTNDDLTNDDADAGVQFRRSITTTRVEREADDATTVTRIGDVATTVTVTHSAKFRIESGLIPDMIAQYGQQPFRPELAEATWTDGAIDRVSLRGPRVLRHGRLSAHEGRSFEYERPWGRGGKPGEISGLVPTERPWGRGGKPGFFDLTRLPQAVQDAIALYESRVDTRSGGPKAVLMTSEEAARSAYGKTADELADEAERGYDPSTFTPRTRP